MPTHYTPIATNAPANAATINAPLDDLDDAIDAIDGGADITDAVLLEWALAGAWQLTDAPTYDGTHTEVVSIVDVLWPDGSSGTYTAVTIDATWLEATEWTLTHDVSSKTVTSTGLARNANGQITTQPTITVT